MKNVMSILKSGVGFLLLAVLITVTVVYFNRGKDVTTKHADNIFSTIEGISVGAVDLSTYDGKSIDGSEVISILESLTSSNLDTPVLVYTNKTAQGTTPETYKYHVAEYTNAGATNGSFLTKDVYRAATTNPASGIEATGSYRDSTNTTYINPTVKYLVKCHYTSNKALAFVTVTQQ